VQLRRHAQAPTVIEDGAFIGSDTQLVAPVRSARALRRRRIVDREDVPPARSAIARGKQSEQDGWVEKKNAKRDGLNRPSADHDTDHMCGIIGYIGEKQVCRSSSTAARLEYRGYDSAAWRSCATANRVAAQRREAERLEEFLAIQSARGEYGIGPHAAGPRTAGDRGERPPASRLHRSASSSSTTASSRTTSI
jgi:hypothetical protein